MTEKQRFLIEGITKDLISFLIEDKALELEAAMQVLYNATLFEKLQNTATGLYLESSAYNYELLKDELSHGRFVQTED